MQDKKGLQDQCEKLESKVISLEGACKQAKAEYEHLQRDYKTVSAEATRLATTNGGLTQVQLPLQLLLQ